MKSILAFVLYGLAILAVTYLIAADGGAMLRGNPIACVSLALIGLGLCRHAREKQRAAVTHE